MVVGYRHQEADRVAGRHDCVENRTDCLLEPLDLLLLTVLGYDVVQGVAPECHHLHVAAIGVEQGRFRPPTAKEVQVGVGDSEHLVIAPPPAHLTDYPADVVLGMCYVYPHPDVIDELPEQPGIRDALDYEEGAVVDGSLHGELVADVLG